MSRLTKEQTEQLHLMAVLAQELKTSLASKKPERQFLVSQGIDLLAASLSTFVELYGYEPPPKRKKKKP